MKMDEPVASDAAMDIHDNLDEEISEQRDSAMETFNAHEDSLQDITEEERADLINHDAKEIASPHEEQNSFSSEHLVDEENSANSPNATIDEVQAFLNDESFEENSSKDASDVAKNQEQESPTKLPLEQESPNTMPLDQETSNISPVEEDSLTTTPLDDGIEEGTFAETSNESSSEQNTQQSSTDQCLEENAIEQADTNEQTPLEIEAQNPLEISSENNGLQANDEASSHSILAEALMRTSPARPELVESEIAVNGTDALSTEDQTPAAAIEEEDPLSLLLEPAIELTENDMPGDGIYEHINENDQSHAADGVSVEQELPLDTFETFLEEAQVPDELTSEEKEYQLKLFGVGHQSVEFLRIHCTACNEHLGTAPNKRHIRCIHPLLKVIICKNCFDFYGSGDFDKDVDGSELYCRWCGQGGNVLCCSNCPYVFCQKCIRSNLGKKYLANVKQLDDWTCFVCRPEEVIRHRVICRSLYEYTQRQLMSGNLDNLKQDKSVCCHNKPKPAVHKVKRDGDTFEVNDAPPKKKTKVNHNTNASGDSQKVWEQQIEDEVVCTPDLSLLMNQEEEEEQQQNASNTAASQPRPEESIETSTPESVTSTSASSAPPALLFLNSNSTPSGFLGFDKKNDSVVKKFTFSNVSTKKTTAPPVSKRVTLKTIPVLQGILQKNKPIAPKDTQTLIAPNYVQFTKSSLEFVNNVNKNCTSKTTLAPNLRHEWFEKAAQSTAQINGSLSTRLCTLSQQQFGVTSLEELANIHNGLQEILSASINDLMQVRKNLRSDFIAGLKKLKFCQNNDNVINISDKDSSTNNCNKNNPSNDDVIVVEPEDPLLIKAPSNSSLVPSTPQVSTTTTSKPAAANTKYYLKVKPLAELSGAPINTTPATSTSLASKSPSFFKIKPLKQLIAKPTRPATPPSNQRIATLTVVKPVTFVIQQPTSTVPTVNGPMAKRLKREKKFEELVAKNMKYNIISPDIDDTLKKKMLSVRVVVETKYGSTTLKDQPQKEFTAFCIDSEDTFVGNGECDTDTVTNFLPASSVGGDDDCNVGIPFLNFQ